MRFFLRYFLLIVSLNACTTAKPKTPFSSVNIPQSPDYGQSKNWAALPNKVDDADRVPGGQLQDRQKEAEADVFFLYPTTYTGHKGENNWNAAPDDSLLNARTDRTAILNQASIFNGSGRVYAPRYRQAHIEAYYTKDKISAKAAFELAYSDVKQAFEYYLEHYNQGRPIIIAAHSQGTNHATSLLKEFFDGQALQKQLVAAYLVGMPILKTEFKNIPLCEEPDALGCFCSWRTFKRGYLPSKLPLGPQIGVTNPLNWTNGDEYAGFEQNKGGVLRHFDKIPKAGLTDAQVNSGLLWAAKPRFFGKIFITFKNYHIADYNLYYVNIRQNAQTRVTAYLRKNSK